MAKKNKMSASQQRSVRIQQIIFGILGIMIIISMVLSMVLY
jgi:predicted nucleic acid-binding Zn ribbon protein